MLRGRKINHGLFASFHRMPPAFLAALSSFPLFQNHQACSCRPKPNKVDINHVMTAKPKWFWPNFRSCFGLIFNKQSLVGFYRYHLYHRCCWDSISSTENTTGLGCSWGDPHMSQLSPPQGSNQLIQGPKLGGNQGITLSNETPSSKRSSTTR